MQRREFLTTSAAALSTSSVLANHQFGGGYSGSKVGIIGHTGRGNYGHGLDVVWTKIGNSYDYAIADANPNGLEKTVNKINSQTQSIRGFQPTIKKGYADYHLMLKEFQPDLVSVCPRHVDQHFDMISASIKAGAKGIYVEKPFCRTPAEADKLKTLVKQHGTKLAVAHRNRYHPVMNDIDVLLEYGEIGEVLEYRGRGKGDRRGGGEDLWVLGSHILNLFHYFGGDPVSCTAMLYQNGKPVTKEHVKEGAEGLGPLAGDEVYARYRMSNGVIATYDSKANINTSPFDYSMKIIGTKGMISIHIDRDPVAYLIPGNPFAPGEKPREWLPITTGGIDEEEPFPERIAHVHNHAFAVVDLLECIGTDREPLCDIQAGAMTVEMICAAFESHRQGGAAVTFPLQQRENALGLL